MIAAISESEAKAACSVAMHNRRPGAEWTFEVGHAAGPHANEVLMVYKGIVERGHWNPA